MVLDNIIEGINAGFYDAFESIVAALPGIIAAIIILIIGYIIGRIVGGGVKRLLEKAKADKKKLKKYNDQTHVRLRGHDLFQTDGSACLIVLLRRLYSSSC